MATTRGSWIAVAAPLFTAVVGDSAVRRRLWLLLMMVSLVLQLHDSLFAQQLYGTINPSQMADVTYLGIDGNISRVVGVGDVDGNGRGDLAFRDLVGKQMILLYNSPSSGSTIDLQHVAGMGGNDTVPGAVLIGTGLTGTDVTFRVAPGGDINADGFTDLLVGEMFHDLGTTGRARLIYGGDQNERPYGLVDLDDVGTSAFPRGATFFGMNADQWIGSAVAGVGDVNGDGIADFLIGAMAEEHPNGCPAVGCTSGLGEDSGFTYLVYGKSASEGMLSGQYPADAIGSSDPILTPDGLVFPVDGVRIVGAFHSEGLGRNVAGGDINGDGLSDLLISTGWSTNTDPSTFEPYEPDEVVYVVFGQNESASPLSGTIFAETIGEPTDIYAYRPADPEVPELLSPITGAVFVGGEMGQIDTNEEQSLYRANVFVLGDVNGDGISDFSMGRTLVFGRLETALQSLGEPVAITHKRKSDGLEPFGEDWERDDYLIKTGRVGVDVDNNGVWDISGLQFSADISPAGDVNGDGLADFIIGDTLLLYGKLESDLFDLTNLVNGHAIGETTNLTDLGVGFDGVDFQLAAGGVLSAAGDINGDGIGDLVFNSPTSGTSGETYVIYGRRNIDGDLNSDGGVDGSDLNIVLDNWGQSVTPWVWALGDIDGDGLVSGTELNFVMDNWGAGSGDSGLAVPEPSTFALTGLALLGLIGYARRK